jgi:hypothetical protein
MLSRVVLVRTEVSEEYIASINRVKEITELGTTSAVTTNRSTLRLLVNANVFPYLANSCHPDDGGDMFL